MMSPDKKVGELAPDATIHLRSCDAALENPRGDVLIEQVALASGLPVTGADGMLWTTAIQVEDTDTWEGYGPEYTLSYGNAFWKSEVQEDGTVKTSCIWRNELVYAETSDESGYWHNPWGVQPY